MLEFFPISPIKAAQNGDLKDLKVQAVMNKTSLFQQDENSEQPIHFVA